MIGGKMMLTEYSPEQYYKETLILPELLCQTQHNSFEQNRQPMADIHGSSSTSSPGSLQLDGNSGAGGGVSEYVHDSLTLTENEASYRSLAPTRKALKLGAIEEILCAPPLVLHSGIHKQVSRSDEMVIDALKGSEEKRPIAHFVEQECQNNLESHYPGGVNLDKTIAKTEQSAYHDETGFRRDVPQERSDDKVEKAEIDQHEIDIQLPPPLNTEDSLSASQTKHMEQQSEAFNQPVLKEEEEESRIPPPHQVLSPEHTSAIHSPIQTQQGQPQQERNKAYNDHDDDGEKQVEAESKRLSLPLPIEIGEGNDSFVEKYEIVARRTNEETDDQLEAISSEQSDENTQDDMRMTTTSSCEESPSIKEPQCKNEIILESSLSYNEVNQQTTAKLTYTTSATSVPVHMNEFLTISMTSIVSPSIHYRSELSFTHQHSDQIKTGTPTTLSNCELDNKPSETSVPTKSGESTTSSTYYTAQSNPIGYGEIEVEVNEQDVVRAVASVNVDKKDSYDDESTLKEDKTPMQNDDVINEAERETTDTETVKASPPPSSHSEAQPDHLHQIDYISPEEEEQEGEKQATEHVDQLEESIEEVNVEAIQSAPDIVNYSLSENIVTYNADGELNERIAVVSLEVDHAQPNDIVDVHDIDADTEVSKQLHLTQVPEQPLDDENQQLQQLTDTTETLADDSQLPITVARTVEVERYDHHDDDELDERQPYPTTSHPIDIKGISEVMQEHPAKPENKILKQTYETVKIEDKQPEIKTIHEEKYHDLYNVKDAREKNVPYESVSELDRLFDTITSGLERKEVESRSLKLVKKQHAVVIKETPIINTAPPHMDQQLSHDDDRQEKSTKLELSQVPVVMDNLTLAKSDTTRADTPVIEFKTVDSPFEIQIKPMEVLQTTGKSVSQTSHDDDDNDDERKLDIHLPEMFTLNEYEDRCEVKELTTGGQGEEEHCQLMKHEKESTPTNLMVCILVQVQTPDTIIMRIEDDNQMLTTTTDELKESYSLRNNEDEEKGGEIVETEGVGITVSLTVNHFDTDNKMLSLQSSKDIQPPPTDLSSETQRLPSPLSPTSSPSASEVVDHLEIMQRQEEEEEDEDGEEDATPKKHFTQLKEDVNILKITSKSTYTSTPLKNYSFRQRTTTTRIPSSFERSTSPQEYTLASTVYLPHSDGATTATATYSESPYPAPTSSSPMTNHLGWLLDSSSCLISRFDERLNKHLIEVSPNNRIFKKATITETSHHQLPTITATDQSPSQEQTTPTIATTPTNRPEGNQLRITISQTIRRNYSYTSKDDMHTENLVSSVSNVITTTTGPHHLRRSLSEDFKGDKHTTTTTTHSEIKKQTSSPLVDDEESEDMYIARKLTNEALNKAIDRLSIVGYTNTTPPPPGPLSYSTPITQRKNKEQKFSDEEAEEIITRLRQEYNIQIPSRIDQHRSTQSPLTFIMSTTPEDTTAPTPTTSIDTPFKIEQDVYSEVSKQTIAIHAKTRIYMFEADEGGTKDEAQGEDAHGEEEEVKDTDMYPVNDGNVIPSISQQCSLNKTDNQVVLQTSLLVTSPKYLTQFIDEEITDLRVQQQHIGVISGSDYSTLAKYSPVDEGDDDDKNNREVENLPGLRDRQEFEQHQSPDGKTVTISPTSVVDDYIVSEDNDEDEGKSTQQQIQEELSALSYAPSTHEFSGSMKKRGSDDRTQNDQPPIEVEDFTRPPDYILTQNYHEISATDAITISQSVDHPINDEEDHHDILSRLTTPPPPPNEYHQQQQDKIQSRNAIKSETITQDFVTIYETPEKIQLVKRSGTSESQSRQELIEDDRYRTISRPFTTPPTPTATTTTTAEILGGEKFKLTNIHEKDTPPPTLSYIHSDNDEGMLQVSMDIDIQANYKLVNSTSDLHDKEEPVTNLTLHLPTTQENNLTLHEVITSQLTKQPTSTTPTNKINNASEKRSPLLTTTAITSLTPESTSEKPRDGMLTGLKEMPTAMRTSPMEIQTTDKSQLSINPQVTCTNLFSIISIQIKLTQAMCKSESHSEAIHFDDTEIKSKSEQHSALLLPKSIDNTTKNTTGNQILSEKHFNQAVREHIDLMTRMSEQERQALVGRTKKKLLKDASILSDDERIKLTAVVQAIQWIADMTDDQRQQILTGRNMVDFPSGTPPPQAISEKMPTENQVFLPSSVDITDKHHSHMNTPHDELQWSTVEANYTQSIETTSQVDSKHTYDLVQRDTPTANTTPTTTTTTAMIITSLNDQHSSKTIEVKQDIEHIVHLSDTNTTAKQMYNDTSKRKLPQLPLSSASASPFEANQKQSSKYPIQKVTRPKKNPLDDTLQNSENPDDLHKPIHNMEERQPQQQQQQQRPLHSDYSLRINKLAQEIPRKIYPSNQATTAASTTQSSLCSPRSIIQTTERVQRAEKVANALDALIIETIDYITKNLHKK
uniref:Uncharacterized protein n=1 Tax=Trichobilharzia regenti TaxID=157069 RepID=A0AA85J979_TRIRE|nr:unnamed protein product [Trichobilharzia regenti]